MKTVGLLRKLRHRGLERVGWMFTLAAAAYNLVRIPGQAFEPQPSSTSCALVGKAYNNGVPSLLTQQNLVRIEVIPNDEDHTFVTNLYCDVNHCGKALSIESKGPKSVQNVSCLEHGFLISFQHQIALGEFVRLLANRVLATDGHPLIEAEALSVFGDERPPVDLSN
jgi:hypothetical protein